MSKIECPLKNKGLHNEANNTYKYANTQFNDGSTKKINKIIKLERTRLLESNINELEKFKKKTSNHRSLHINRGKTYKIKYDMFDGNIDKYQIETENINNSNIENIAKKTKLQDKLFKINELIKKKENELEKINDDLSSNKNTTAIDLKNNKILRGFNIGFFCIVIIILLYINLSSDLKYKTRRKLSTIKNTITKKQSKRLFNSNDNKKKEELLYNNDNKKKQKQLIKK